MATDLPNLKDIELFTEIYSILKRHNLTLTALARERLMRSPSTVSECVTSLGAFYGKVLIESKGGFAKPTEAADKIIPVFERLLRLARTLGETEETKKRYDVRVLTTVSLRNRLFPGPIAAFMMWLKMRGQHTQVRMIVDTCNHNELMHKLSEGGIHSYHWGICWALPQAASNSYLEFHPIPFSDEQQHENSITPCTTPVVAFTGDLTFGVQDDDLKALFKNNEPIEFMDLLPKIPQTRVAVVNSEPEDDLRKALMHAVDRDSTIRVHQYEEALSHVRSLDADLAFGPGWYRFRAHTVGREVTLDGNPCIREVQLVSRKSESWSRGVEVSPTPMEEPVKAFHTIFRLFMSDPAFGSKLFVPHLPISKKKGLHVRGAVSSPSEDPASEINHEEISKWINDATRLKEIERRMRELP